MILDRGLELPVEFARLQTGFLATWDGTAWHPEFQAFVRALSGRLGDPPKPIPAHPPYPAYSSEVLGQRRPQSVSELTLPRVVHPSPREWSDEVLYLLIPDRFSDGREHGRKLLDRDLPPTAPRAEAGGVPLDRWFESGARRWQGGTLAGVTTMP